MSVVSFCVSAGMEALSAFLEWSVHMQFVTLQQVTSRMQPRLWLSTRSSQDTPPFRFVFNGFACLLVYKWVFFRPTMRLLQWASGAADVPPRLRAGAHTHLDMSSVEGVDQNVSQALEIDENRAAISATLVTWFDSAIDFLNAHRKNVAFTVVSHAVAIAGTYPLLVVSTRLALQNDSATLAHCLAALKTAPLAELYAGALPRLTGIAIHAAVAVAAIDVTCRLLRVVRRNVTLAQLDGAGDWMRNVMSHVALIGAVGLASFAAHPFNLLATRARAGVISPQSVSSLAGIVRELGTIVRDESVFALWRGTAFVTSWRLLAIMSPLRLRSFAFVTVNSFTA
jgi:hypothetical protein